MLVVYLHHAEIVSGEENQSRRETGTLLKNTEEGGTEQGGGTDGPSWRHRGRRKRLVPLSPWKSGVLVQMAVEGDRGSGKGGREGQDPTDGADRMGSPEWAD